MEFSAKAYLRQLINLEMYIRAKKEDYSMTVAAAMQLSSRPKGAKVKSSGNPKMQEELIIKYLNISDDIDRATRELIVLKEEARELIERLEDNRFRTVLTERYILGKSWENVARSTNYDEKYAIKLHGYALLAFEKLIEKEDTKRHLDP